MADTSQKIIEVIIKGQQPNATINQITSSARVLNAEMKKLPVSSAEFKQKAEELKSVNARLKAIKEDVNNIKPAFTGAAQATSGWKDTLKGIFTAGLLERGISVVKDFGVECIKAFSDAQKNANNLQFALENIAGEGKGALGKLLEQSEKLQKQGIFSDDDIQKSQTAQIQFGLTSKQVEKLTPQILDLAAAQGIDLATATDKVLSAVNGQTKGLKLAGIAFDDTGSKTENLALITDKLTKFQGANAAELENNIGQHKRWENAIDDVKEKIGELLSNEGSKFLDMIDTVFNGKGQEVATRNAIQKYISFLDEANAKSLDQIESGEKSKAQVISENSAYILKLYALRGKQEKYEQQKMLDAQIKNQEKFNLELRNNEALVRDDLTQKGLAGAEEANKKLLDARKKLHEDLAALEYEFSLKGLSEDDKKIFAIHKKYDKLKEAAAGNAGDLMRIQKLYNKELEAATGEIDTKMLENHKAYAEKMVAVDVQHAANSKKVYELDFQDKIALAYEFFKKYASLYDEFASRANRIMDLYAKKQLARDKQELESNDYTLSEKSRQNDEYLRAGLIDQKTHDAKAITLKKEHDKRKADIEHKAAERAKQLAIAKAVIDGIGAVVKDLASYAYPYNLIVAALDAAIIGAEIAMMKSAPAYEKGGYNKTSNNPQGYTSDATLFTNSASGQLFIAGEKGKEWIAPNWMLENPATANIINELENIRVAKTFASGGSTTGRLNPTYSSNSTGNNSQLITVVNRLCNILDGGIEAHLYYDKFKKTLAKIDNAKGSARVD